MYNFYDGGEGVVEGEADVEVCDAFHIYLYALLNMSEAEDRPCTVAVDMMKASSLAISNLQHGTLGGGGTSPAVEARGVPASRSHCSLRTSSALENTHGEHPINMELL